ncbi:hypothetical protein [Corallococcus macrosporus]|uniref:hypothetical protein n=1 Tax=Corallococcus macrosporus TaxID=35 RepID=UPI000683262F|nr:hypothetical protein [Corallococcus macrosporus]
MTSTHTRPTPSVSASPVESLAPLPAPASLTALREALGSPGVIPAEVDALLAAMAQAPEGDEARRERTNFLLSLMTLPGDASVQTGSAGITVRTAAVEALLELGYPYALEVPPDALAWARRERGTSRRGAPASRLSPPKLAVAVTALCAVLQLFFVFSTYRSALGNGMRWEELLLVLAAVTPALLATLGVWLRARPLQSLGSVGLGLQGLFWLGALLLFAWLTEHSDWLWLALPWYLPLISAYLMWPRREPDGPGAVLPEPAPP